MAASVAAAQAPEPGFRHKSFISGPCVIAISPDSLRYSITGRVIDNRTGQPIAGASVNLSSDCISPPVDGQPRRSAWTDQVTSDPKGNSIFKAVPAMGVYLSAELDGYQEVSTLENGIVFEMRILYGVGPPSEPIKRKSAFYRTGQTISVIQSFGSG